LGAGYRYDLTQKIIIITIWVSIPTNLGSGNSNLIKYFGDFLGRVFQKDRNKKTNDGVFLGTLGTFQNGKLENILYGAFREMAHSDNFLITVIVN
jgi:hypothetical protein